MPVKNRETITYEPFPLNHDSWHGPALESPSELFSSRSLIYFYRGHYKCVQYHRKGLPFMELQLLHILCSALYRLNVFVCSDWSWSIFCRTKAREIVDTRHSDTTITYPCTPAGMEHVFVFPFRCHSRDELVGSAEEANCCNKWTDNFSSHVTVNWKRSGVRTEIAMKLSLNDPPANLHLHWTDGR